MGGCFSRVGQVPPYTFRQKIFSAMTSERASVILTEVCEKEKNVHPPWLEERAEFGEVAALKRLLEDTIASKRVREIFENESPAALEREKAEAEGRPVRRRKLR